MKKQKTAQPSAAALRRKATVACDAGRLREAERWLGEANVVCMDTDDRLLEAQIARDLGLVLSRQQRSAEARAALSLARELFQNIGATLDLEYVEKQLCGMALSG
jgi:hypothetical protein